MRNASKRNGCVRNVNDEIPDPVYARIRSILKTMAGFHLHGYKDACIKRRISARIRSAGCASASEYVDLLMLNRAESARLIKMLTIHVSKFFRNQNTFDKLRDEIFPYLFSRCRLNNRDCLAIQSVGCASGEEPYSLAMILHDSFVRELSGINVSIRALDIDREVLKFAAEACYDADHLEETPPFHKERYFTLHNGKYRLVPEIRNMVFFQCHDMLRPAPLQESDLILCRNVLIYFERSHQKEILKRFAASLRPGGILVLDETETLMGEVRGLYQTVCPVERIYRVR
ncbi:MAG TPA: protein-glutamate O-methyltransferase CheR [Geobacteraceae bacterium]|nr:protein-glutamate O-methyltransferase CheR [Geobacteraceae bacterium]